MEKYQKNDPRDEAVEQNENQEEQKEGRIRRELLKQVLINNSRPNFPRCGDYVETAFDLLIEYATK